MITIDLNSLEDLKLRCNQYLGEGIPNICAQLCAQPGGLQLHLACDPKQLFLKPSCDSELCLSLRCGCLHYVLGTRLTEALKACGEEFYIRCPEFDDLARVSDFEPAIDAAKFKKKLQLERIAQLEARVQELELKRKG